VNFRRRVTARFREMPIRRKLRVIFTFTTGFALLLAGVAIVAADTFLFYNYLERDLETFARVIGDNSSGALAFEDPDVGRETLMALRSRSHVQTACLYRKDGTRLSTYARTDFPGPCPMAAREGIRLENRSLVVSHQIYFRGAHVGSLALQYDLEEIPARVQLYGVTVLAALILASVTALVLSARLRALIAEPILELARLANAVAQSKNYAIRTKKVSDDEVGVMAAALNQMLDGIQSRDDDLRTALETQRNTLAQLSQVNAELARSNQDLERFAFVASHDLQEPLRMITTYSQLLVAEHPAQSKGQGREAQYVAHIVSGNRRMRELLSDLLAYTEMAGSTEQPTEVVDLNVVLIETQEALAARVAEAEAVITIDMLPALHAHPSRMNSLFLNLVGNALKYRGERRARVHVWVDTIEDMFRFSVADNGIGIAPEDQKRIFEAFKRLHGREIPGTGIGLAICQRIVERYGGEIWVESQPGAGSTFRFTLPVGMAARAG
jgi:signal transduction histidine kinase